MYVEFNFKLLNSLNAGEAHRKIEEILNAYFRDVVDFKVESVTCMSNFFVVLINFPETWRITPDVEALFDAVAGAIVYTLDCKVRYRHYEVHGRTGSLIYHKEWREPKIALSVIAKDEAPYIRDFIEHIKDWVDDIVVLVDTRTKDSTWDEAVAAGGRAFYGEWRDSFADFRNQTLKLVDPKCEWILWLDVDERADAELLQNMRELVQTDKYDAFSFIRVELATKTETRVTRLFRKDKGYWKGRVHEVVAGIPEERVCHTDFKILHLQRWIVQGGKTAEERNSFYRYLESLPT